GSSRQLSTGSVALVSLMTAAALQPIAPPESPEYITYTILLALMVGVVQLGMGLLRMGVLVNFLAHPVVLGFTNAGAIIIGTSQIDEVFGVHVPGGGQHSERVWLMLKASAMGYHLPTLGMAVLAFAMMVVLRRLNPRIPGVLIAVVCTTLLSAFTGFEKLGGRVVGTLPEGLPAFQVPALSLQTVSQLFSAAVTIALIGFVGTISIAKAMATQTRQRLGANRELIGQGLSNIVGSLFQSHPVSGSFARSAVNLRAGAVTGFSSVVAGAAAVAALLWLTPFLYHLPLATLAAIIMVSVFGLVQVKPILRAWRVHRHDGIVAVVTFVMTLAFAPFLDRGILFGVGLSLILYLYRTMKPRVAFLSRHPDGMLRDADVYDLESCGKIAVLRFDGSLYFGSAGYFEDKVLERVSQEPDLKCLVVDAEGINQIDITGEEMLLGVVRLLREAGVEVLFAHTKKQILDALDRTGFLEQLGSKRFFSSTNQALNHAWVKLVEVQATSCSEDCPLDCPLNRPRLNPSVPNYRV
ncbi:MAG: SulP family inorganic anion transporter, partial [bacterium]|nr:SulP family inorganic anion transporter [bacterium]